ncbi:MAG: hypothetical protein U0519_00460 [Candidatus Gracilibacteria bacterium]
MKVVLEALQRKGIIDMGAVPLTEPYYTPYIQIAQDLTPYLKQKDRVRTAFIITPEEALKPEANLTRGEFIAMADRVLTAYDCSLIDDDGDGMPSFWETKNGLNPHDPRDANQDPDGDGLTNLEEYKHGTDPHNPDTDKGGVRDGDEVKKATNPLDPSDDPIDKDGDGLPDKDELKVYHTDPNDPDTDKGGVKDGDEILINNTDPLDPSDDKDTDGDGLSDYDEKNIYGTDPFNPDTDGGGINDGTEVSRGTDPLNPADDLIDPRKDLGEGIYVIQPECTTCPCPSTIDHTADIIPGDKLFAIISNDDNTEIFSRVTWLKGKRFGRKTGDRFLIRLCPSDKNPFPWYNTKIGKTSGNNSSATRLPDGRHGPGAVFGVFNQRRRLPGGGFVAYPFVILPLNQQTSMNRNGFRLRSRFSQLGNQPEQNTTRIFSRRLLWLSQPQVKLIRHNDTIYFGWHSTKRLNPANCKQIVVTLNDNMLEPMRSLVKNLSCLKSTSRLMPNWPISSSSLFIGKPIWTLLPASFRAIQNPAASKDKKTYEKKFRYNQHSGSRHSSVVDGDHGLYFQGCGRRH